MDKYYIYRHVRLDTDEVFYIGRGTKSKTFSKTIENEYKRAYSKKRSGFWENITNKTTYSIDILFESNDIEIIKNKEIEYVKLYGRRDLGLGTLVNLTDGGEETNRTYSKERNLKISIALKNRVRKQSTFLKISQSKYKPIVSLLNGVIIKEYKSLTEASEELNITIPAISKALKNEKYTARGYKWKYKSL